MFYTKLVVFFFSLVLMICVNPVYSQQNEQGKLTLHQDEQLDRLINRHIKLNEKRDGISGYRIQIHFGLQREQAKEVKSKFLGQFPDINAYEAYQQPNYKIKVGDYRTKMEAEKMLKEILISFPSSFIVADDIKLPPL